MSDPRRILVIRRRYLGDIVLLSPFFRNLRLHWPEAKIALLAEPGYLAVAGLIPEVDETIALPTGASPGAWLRLGVALRKGKFTHVFDLDNRQKTALLARFTGAPVRIALHHETPPQAPRCYTQIVFDPPALHEQRTISEYYLQALRAVDVPIATREVRLIPRASDIAKVAPLLGTAVQRAGRQPAKILLHPGSRSSCRRWPAENFAAVCDRGQDELEAQFFLIGGPGEAEFLREIQGRAKTHVVLLDRAFTVGQFAAIAAQCDALLCHDSGPMHVAAAVGTPVIALFGSQNVALWRPDGPGHQVLQASTPCGDACVAPQQCVREDSYRSYCVRRLGVDQVFAAVHAAVRR